MQRSFLAHWASNASTPALLVNATDSASGRRIVIAPFAFSRSAELGLSARSFTHYPFWSASCTTTSDGRPAAVAPAPENSLAAAAGVSARFPWITPAASVLLTNRETGRQRKIRLVDGGHADNSGGEADVSGAGVRCDLSPLLASERAPVDFQSRSRGSIQGAVGPSFVDMMPAKALFRGRHCELASRRVV